ncbi:hypothetical protein Q7P37_005249 [Cladosporium fusiforme]
MASHLFVQGPITQRLSTDETDSESLASQSSGYDDIDDESISGTSEFAGYIDNRQYHLLRRRQSQPRIDRTLHNAQVRMRHAHADGGLLWLEIRARLDQLLFNTKVFLLVIWKLLVRFFWWLVDLARISGVLFGRALLYLCLLLNRGFWWVLDLAIVSGVLFGRSLLYLGRLLNQGFWWFLDLAAFSGLLFGRSLLYLYLHLYKPVIYLITIGLLMQPLIGGYKGIVTYACHDPKAMPGMNVSSDACNARNLTQSKSDLAHLMAAHETVLAAVRAINSPFVLDLDATNNLVGEFENVARVVKDNRHFLTNRGDIEDAIPIMRENVLKVSSSAKNFKGDYTVQRDVLVDRLYNILVAADEIKPHTASDRFQAEALFNIFPFVFTHSRSVGVVNTYAKTLENIEKAPETKALYDHYIVLTENYDELRHLLEDVRQGIMEVVPSWKIECEKHRGKERCTIDPEAALDQFDASLARTEGTVQRIKTAHKDRQNALKGLSALHLRLNHLLAEAYASHGAFSAQKKIAEAAELNGVDFRQPAEPMVARAILYQFASWLRGQKRKMEVKSKGRKAVFDNTVRSLPRVCKKGEKCDFVYIPQVMI